MRLLHTLNNDQEARLFSQFLQKKKVDHQLEMSLNTDWGSSDYGTITSKIWVINEDDFEKAQQLLHTFSENPPSYYPSPQVPLSISHNEPLKDTPSTPRTRRAETAGGLTILLILLCTVLYFFSSMTQPKIEETPPPYLPLIPLYDSPMKRAFFFDYPYTYDLTEKLVDTYGFVYYANKLPPEGKALATEISQTPYWKGLYPKIVSYLRHEPVSFKEPLFEKIKQGEVWRLITPILLHNDILHLFFNMMWLLVLGTQIESRLKIGRFIGFILLAGVITNLAQYAMTGSNFLGFSGVLTAMITFVWFRRQRAPWEGYHFLPSTMAFITFFILGIAAFQVVSFVFEITNDTAIAPPIANTAHLVGGVLGYFLARTPLFIRKLSK